MSKAKREVVELLRLLSYGKGGSCADKYDNAAGFLLETILLAMSGKEQK